MDNNPILSICIPTYNRAQQLRQCLDSLVVQKEFLSGDVEIVISDNCSTDDTEAVAREYFEKYDNCHYFRNEKNVRDINFPLSIDRAKGAYRKLSNDTMIWDGDSLSFMLSVIRGNIEEKPVLTFLPKADGEEYIRTSSLEETLAVTSHLCTAISCFGVWADHFQYTEDGCDKFLWQTQFFLKNVVEKNQVLIVKKSFYHIIGVKKKDLSYGFFNVFYNNFLGMIKYWVDRSNLSVDMYNKIKKDLLLDIFARFLAEYKVSNKEKFKFSETEDLQKCIEDAYKEEPYYKDFLKRTKKIEISLRHPKFTKFAVRILRIIKRQKG